MKSRLNVDLVVADFVAYWIGKGERRANWPRTFGNEVTRIHRTDWLLEKYALLPGQEASVGGVARPAPKPEYGPPAAPGAGAQRIIEALKARSAPPSLFEDLT